MASVSEGQPALGDILSLALMSTGVPSAQTARQLSHEGQNSVLDEAANVFTNSLFPSDLAESPSSDFSTPKGTTSLTNDRNATTFPVSSSITVNGAGQVLTPNCTVSSAPAPLSMPVLVTPQASTEQYTLPTYPQTNSVRDYTYTSSQAAARTVVSTPVANSTTGGGFPAGVSSGNIHHQQQQQQTGSTFGSQGGTPGQMNANRNAHQYDHQGYNTVLDADEIDFKGLDELFGEDSAMDIPPGPATSQFQNHGAAQQQLPQTYSNSGYMVNGPTDCGQGGYLQSSGGGMAPQNVNSGSPAAGGGMPPFNTNSGGQQQQYSPQYGIQQSLMSPSYPAQGSQMPSQIPCPPTQQAAFNTRPLAQQMVPVSSVNGGHFASAQPSTDLSNIMPSTSYLPSLPANGGDLVSLSSTDIHDILDLDDVDLDLSFDLDTNISTDPFSSFGMPPVNLLQSSNRFNGTTTAALVSSNASQSSINAPPSHVRLHQQANGSRPNGVGPAYSPTQHAASAALRSKFNIHNPMFGRGRQSPLSNISRVRTVGGGRGAGIPMPSQPMVPEAADDDSDEEEEFGAADTYANYKPAKLSIGKEHPDPVVESSSLSSVEPPRVWFDLSLPSPVIDEVRLSSLQLEAVVYACQQHKNILADGTRAGFLVGDGAGVGKGRTIAGIIYQNYMEGRKKALWLSVSNDLKYDAVRDLRDLGATNIKVFSLNKFRYGKISGKRNGRVRKGVIFATYSSLIGESSSGGKYRTRLNQLLHWLGSQFEGVIVFDECHKAKNLVPSGSGKPSKTGLTVLQLQKKLPKARIVYCSATGASEPKNMAYMSRLGIWGVGTQFPSFHEFIKAVERRGVGAMELVAMDMKLRGMYMARQLSFAGVSFSVNEVQLTQRFIEAYDASVELWNKCHQMFKEASEIMGYDKQQLKTMWGQFWASHQRFFKYMCIAAKVPEVIKLAKQALQDGKCVVIGLQSTGEARTLEQLERNSGELTGFISTAKGVLETLIRRHFPAPPSALAGIDWRLLDNDPTLPRSCRKRKRAAPRSRMTTFQDDKDGGMSDSDDSSTPGGSDSAVESSSDDGDDKGETSDDSDSDSSSDEKSSGVDSDKEDFNPFGSTMNEPWLQSKPKKSKKRKSSPTNGTPPKKKKRKQKNYSIKPPPTSSRRGKTKTGFNSKSLKFEPVQSPSEFLNKKPQPPQPAILDRRQSIAVVEGLANNRSSPSSHALNSSTAPPPSHLMERKCSLQVTGVGEGQSLVDAMSARSSPGLGDATMMSNRDGLVRTMKDELMKKLDVLAPHLPTNTLDELVDGLGGPDNVAEMTGRRGRVVSLPDGSVQYQLRSETDVSMEVLNIAEKQRFMDGEKDVAIISEAASSGISLQADRRVKNLKRRVHITLELPWSADRAIQQFGRTHRSNQVSAPEYVFLISSLSGEQRFASIVAKRLESLGALTHGDRRATESRDLSKYNLDTKFGHQALEITLKSIAGVSKPSVKSEEYTPEFFKKCQTALVGAGLVSPQGLSNSLTVEKDALNMSRFLNRILGLPVHLQNQLFSYFTDTLAAVCQQAKKLGKFDSGIQDLGAQGEHVEIVETKEYLGDPAFGTATTQLVKVKVERGMSFKEAIQKLNTDQLPGDGFCVSNKVYSDNKHTAILIKAVDRLGKSYKVYRPNTGVGKTEKLSSLMKRYKKVTNEEAERWWTDQYDGSISTCQHAYTQGKCRNMDSCEVGLRHRNHHVLSGSVLGVWTHIEGVFARHSTHNPRMQIIRVRTPEKRLSGIVIPGSFVEDMTQTLARIDKQATGTGTSDDPIQL